MIFDRVITNEGASYNGITGLFTCKVPGLYVFYVHTLANPGKHVDTVIRTNAQEIAWTYAMDKEAYSSGSNMAVIRLNVDDTVSVQTNGSEHDRDGPIGDYKYTPFSGFLLNI